jgi:hypothetical protein
MRGAFGAAAQIARSIERAACAARFWGKTGKGKISPEALESILAHPGEPIFRETGAAGAWERISAISHRSDLRSAKTAYSMQTRIEFSTAARAYVRVKRRTRAAVENSCTAVQHLTKALFLSKPVEPPLITSRLTSPRTHLAGSAHSSSLDTCPSLRRLLIELHRMIYSMHPGGMCYRLSR